MMNEHQLGGGMTGTINSSMISDNLSEPSSPDSSADCDETDLNHLYSSVSDDVTAQLAASGPVGVAAAAAIASARKRKRPHSFETNPSIRKRQQTRLLRKLKATIEEYTTRVGQQAVILSCTPCKNNQVLNSYKVFGSQPLENVIKNNKNTIMHELEQALAEQAPPRAPEQSGLHELPPLAIDGIPTAIDKMTQAQLRAFIPEMLKYSTGRSKPGWGKMECRPPWWPEDVPWANVRSDVRTEDQKKMVSWTVALRTIVRNCYQHHGREDLIPDFHEGDSSTSTHHPTLTQAQFPPTMVQTINNPDGTVSIIQIDTSDMPQPQIVTLADGTQAQLYHTLPRSVNDNAQPNHTPLPDTAATHALSQVTSAGTGVEMGGGDGHQQMATLAEATINSDGQIILTGDASLGGMVSIPVSVYQSVVNNYAHLQQQPGVQIALGQNQVEQVTGPIEIKQQPMDDEDSQPQQQTNQTEAAPITSQQSSNGNVPEATHAVEVMTVDTNS